MGGGKVTKVKRQFPEEYFIFFKGNFLCQNNFMVGNFTHQIKNKQIWGPEGSCYIRIFIWEKDVLIVVQTFIPFNRWLDKTHKKNPVSSFL